MDGKSVEPSIAKACVTEFMKAVKRNVLKGFRCQLGDNFLTVYPNLQLSVKDTEDPETHAPVVATAEMLNAANGKSRLGCTVAAKFLRMLDTYNFNIRKVQTVIRLREGEWVPVA